MSAAAEEDTELRDLLIHTLESNGVLSKIKAELRASVFLALEEQERAESKPSLINESLRHFLATKDGRLVAGLVTDFLQHFHLDFTLAVLQPEACLPGAPDERLATARELGLGLPERKAPLLLELVRRCQQREAVPPELPPEHAAEAQALFRRCCREGSGELGEGELRALLADLCPLLPGAMLDAYVTAELADRRGGMDEQGFLAAYRQLFLRCRSVVLRDLPYRTDGGGAKTAEDSRLEEDDVEGDSFFDDPVSKPEKTHGWKEAVSTVNGHPQSSPPGSPGDSSARERGSSPGKAAAPPEEDYLDDFHSSSQRSEKSEVSIGEDLEEELSMEELTVSDARLEELTLDNSLSHASDVADYLEEVS